MERATESRPRAARPEPPAILSAVGGAMSIVSVEDRRGRRWFVITRSRLAIDALVIGSVATAIGCLLLTGHRGPTWPALVIVLFALIALVLPDSEAAMAAMMAY